MSSWSSVQLRHFPAPLRMQRLQEGDAFDLWFCRSEDLPPNLLAHPESIGLLSSFELERSRRFRFTRDRDAFLTKRILVRSVLSHYADIAPTEWQFTANAFGRPEISPAIQARIARGTGSGDLLFNLSRSGSLCMCAVSTSGRIGVDVEDTRQHPNLMALAGEALSQSELDHLMELPEGERKATFLQLWVLKEAYTKACGVGLHIDLRAVTFSGLGCGPIQVETSVALLNSPGPWQFELLQPLEHFCSAVAYSRIPA